MPSNKLLPIAAGVVMIMVILIGIKSCNKKTNNNAMLRGIPRLNSPDADSPADTLRSLTAEVVAMKKKSEELNKQNQLLLQQKETISRDVEAKLRQEINKKSSGKSQLDKMVGELSKQLDFFKLRVDDISANQEIIASDIPIGFGLENEDSIDKKKIVWIEPLGTQLDQQGNPIIDQNLSSASLLNPNNENSLDVEGILSNTSDTNAETEKPVYTVPRNSTLIGSTSMTALIGRIPLNNIVQEPFPFKVIVGKDNLATNGIEMPFLDGMIFSGTTTGDWTLSCVRGTVDSVTFVFTDGTIRTLSSDESGSGSGSNTFSAQSSRPLGWISDRRGIPCVAGQRISNASEFLTGRIIASAASAAARAFAQNEVTTTVSPSQGVATSFITGDAATNAGYNALSGGADEISEYIRERGAQSFDVIYVDTGVELAIHVDVELPIDYEINGRKTYYANQTTDNQFLD